MRITTLCFLAKNTNEFLACNKLFGICHLVKAPSYLKVRLALLVLRRVLIEGKSLGSTKDS